MIHAILTIDDIASANTSAIVDYLNEKGIAALLVDPGSHILLLHAHDETDELVPGYYRQFIDYLLKEGVVFDTPEFM